MLTAPLFCTDQRHNRNGFIAGMGLGLLLLAFGPVIAGTGPQPTPHYRWNNVTVGGGGFSPNIIFSPLEPGLAYLRTDIGGLYRFDSGDRRWIPLQDGMSEGNYFGVESVATDPRDVNVVYAAVGMYGSGPAAIMRSEDRGAHWNIAPVAFRMGGNEDGRGLGERLAVDPHDTRIVYFGSRHDSLQRSDDRGRTWRRMLAFPVSGLGMPEPRRTHGGISFVLFDARSGVDGAATRTLFAGVADNGEHHLFRSDDAGASWRAVPREPRADLLPVRAQLDAKGILYIAYSNGIGPNGITEGAVFKLDTATEVWRDITPRADPKPPGGYMGLAVDLRRPDTVLVATVDQWMGPDTIWRSTDAGTHWTSLRSLSAIDASDTPFLRWGKAQATFGWWIAGLTVDPFDSNHVVYTTGATVYATQGPLTVSTSPPLQWRPWVAGIEETAILAVASPPRGPPLFSGFGDIGGFVHEDLRASPASMYTNPIFNNTDTLDSAGLAPHVMVRGGRAQRGVAACAWSQDFGKTWQPLDPVRAERSEPAQGSGRNAEPAPTVSADGATFIVTTRTALLTRDRGQSWTAVRGLPDFARPVADRTDATRFYAVDFQHSQLLRSEDGGASFALLASSRLPCDLKDEQPTRQVPSPLLATPGRTGDLWLVCKQGLYHSVDGGLRFEQRRSDLNVGALGFGKGASEHGYPTLFAIGTRGDLTAIWRSDDAGTSWARINDAAHEYGRRFRVITGDPRVYGRVYVGTDGRGLLYGEPDS
jgi:xyloglucan-specific exo-beta-1,4-glucanase